MAKYTTLLKTLIENDFDIGLKDYPLFDESYRDTLNKKIIDHFYYQEIGFETAALFKHYLNVTMQEIMPYYNELYKTQELVKNPLTTDDIQQTDIIDRNDAKKNVYSETPQGMLSIGDVNSETYATNATLDEIKTHDEHTLNRKGRSGISESALLAQYRSTFINIDMMIIEELQNLFMGVY